MLDKSNEITQEVNNEINEDITAADKEAGEKLKRKRPPLNFREMGIQAGSLLQYARSDERAKVEVCADRKVFYKGEERSLTSITQELLGLEYNVQPTPFGTYNGKKLGDI